MNELSISQAVAALAWKQQFHKQMNNVLKGLLGHIEMKLLLLWKESESILKLLLSVHWVTSSFSELICECFVGILGVVQCSWVLLCCSYYRIVLLMMLRNRLIQFTHWNLLWHHILKMQIQPYLFINHCCFMGQMLSRANLIFYFLFRQGYS